MPWRDHKYYPGEGTKGFERGQTTLEDFDAHGNRKSNEKLQRKKGRLKKLSSKLYD